jgi:hypothetical protein
VTPAETAYWIDRMKKDRPTFAEHVLHLAPGSEPYESYVRGEWDRCIYSDKPKREWPYR